MEPEMVKIKRRLPLHIEPLESRTFRSVAPLSASAVEGSYAGSISYRGTSRALELAVTSTSESLTEVGLTSRGSRHSEQIAISSLQFHRLRDKVFVYSGTIDGEHFSFSGSVSCAGDLITGTFTGSGRIAISGKFELVKQ
jgi:hypothetical protein